jgi:hypothetical protein
MITHLNLQQTPQYASVTQDLSFQEVFAYVIPVLTSIFQAKLVRFYLLTPLEAPAIIHLGVVMQDII